MSAEKKFGSKTHYIAIIVVGAAVFIAFTLYSSQAMSEEEKSVETVKQFLSNHGLMQEKMQAVEGWLAKKYRNGYYRVRFSEEGPTDPQGLIFEVDINTEEVKPVNEPAKELVELSE